MLEKRTACFLDREEKSSAEIQKRISRDGSVIAGPEWETDRRAPWPGFRDQGC